MAGAGSRPQSVAFLCLRCSVRLSEARGRHALATGGVLEEVCDVCYLVGLLTQLVQENRLTLEDRAVLAEELAAIVAAFWAHVTEPGRHAP